MLLLSGLVNLPKISQQTFPKHSLCSRHCAGHCAHYKEGLLSSKGFQTTPLLSFALSLIPSPPLALRTLVNADGTHALHLQDRFGP